MNQRHPAVLSELLTIEPMRRRDLDQVLRIESCSFPHPWTRKMFETELDRRPAICLVARNGWEICGYLIFWLIAPEIHILNIAVKPDLRQLGLGRLLMNYLFEYARDTKVEDIHLEVRPSNTSARMLYQGMGFVSTGRRKNYYSEEHEDALLMTKHF